jgi:hypothetical protein
MKVFTSWLSLGSLVGIVCITAAGAWGQMETRSQAVTNLTPISVAVADFNLDGKMDIAVASAGNGSLPFEVQIFLGNGDGTFGRPKAYDIDVAAGPIAVADLNHDGKPDLVVGNEASGVVTVLLGNGDGSFQAPVAYETPTGVEGLVLGDFNGDGRLDIATIEQGNSTSTCYCVGVLLGNGDGTFQQPAIVTPLAGFPEALAAGHFDGGKDLDLAVTVDQGNAGEVQILLGNGDGTFRIGADYAVAPEPQSIIAADFRGNRKTDLAVGEFEGTGVAVLLGNGDGTFEQPVVYQAGTPLGVASADINGDGIPDLIATTPGLSSGFAEVLLGNGDGTFKRATSYPSGNFPWAVAIADFNGDGRPDITIVDEGANLEYVLLNTGAVIFSPTSPLNFKKQTVGTTSTAQKVRLTNSAKTELKISAMESSAQFGMTSTCGKGILAGASCTISVTFSPASKGAKSGTVTINDSASSKPQVIELSGTGT